MNRLILQAQLVERAMLRYTPAGLPALEVSLKHESEVSEDNKPRKVSLEMKALGIGSITQQLTPLALGSSGMFAGFLTNARNGRGLLFHITSFEALATEPQPQRALNPD